MPRPNKRVQKSRWANGAKHVYIKRPKQAEELVEDTTEDVDDFNLPSDDEGVVYVEETAWREFNPHPPPTAEGEDIPEAVASEHLKPLPPAPPIPELPNTGKCKWSFDADSRVLLAEFVLKKKNAKLDYDDEQFLLEMMERDDITVISEGLATGLDPNLWTLEHLSSTVGHDHHHKFRAFERDDLSNDTGAEHNAAKYREKDSSFTMSVKDFVRYIQRKKDVMNGETEQNSFSFLDNSGVEQTIDLASVVLYMIDFDVVKLLPKLHQDFRKKFGLTECLPGGEHCMVNSVR